MYKIVTVTISELLNKKFLQWQVDEGKRKTIAEFASLFGVKHSTMVMWMNGDRSPGPDYQKRIIERYGEEALIAFGEDPDLYYVQSAWDTLTPETRKAVREQVEQLASKNGKRK